MRCDLIGGRDPLHVWNSVLKPSMSELAAEQCSRGGVSGASIPPARFVVFDDAREVPLSARLTSVSDAQLFIVRDLAMLHNADTLAIRVSIYLCLLS